MTLCPAHDVTELEALAETAPEYAPESKGEACILTARDFLAAVRPPLEFHIDGLLPRRGKLAFSAPAKAGKSWAAMEIGLALAAGESGFLGWRFGPPARVLYLQAEISDQLIEKRLRWLFDTAPEWLDSERALDGFSIQSLEPLPPELMSDAGKARIEASIRKHKPEILILDPLCFLFPGLEENQSEAMSNALTYLTGLTTRFGCAVILIHHHGKGGTSRGSSVYEGWPESDLQASFVDASREPGLVRVTGRLRCAFNSGPWYWRMPERGRCWIEAEPEGWEPIRECAGRPKKGNPETVLELLAANSGSLAPGELQALFITATGCKQRTAERAIEAAIKAETIIKAGGRFLLSDRSANSSKPVKTILTVQGARP